MDKSLLKWTQDRNCLPANGARIMSMTAQLLQVGRPYLVFRKEGLHLYVSDTKAPSQYKDRLSEIWDFHVSTLPIIIFFRGCVPGMLVTSYSVTYWIYIPGKPGFCFHYYCSVYDSANSRIRFGLQIVFVCFYITPSHYHHCANLFEDVEHIKYLSDIFCRVCE